MREIRLDDYVLHSLSVRMPSTVLPGLNGLAAADDRLGVITTGGDHGANITSALSAARVISISGTLRSDGLDYQAKRRAFNAATANVRDVDGRPVPRTLYLTDMDGATYQMEVFRQSLNHPHDTPTHAEYLLQLIAPDPIIYSQDEVTVTVSPPSGGGFLLPTLMPIVFDPTVGGSATITNAGDVISKPIIELYGPLTNPIITNEATGRSIGLNLTLVDGEVVILNHRRRTAIQGGSTNRMGALMPSPRWWGLQPGANVISLVAENGSTGFAIIRGRSAWGGI